MADEKNNQNLNIYSHLKSVEAIAKRPFNNGRFSGTDINPQWRIRKMTEEFGPIGIGWYEEVVDNWIQEFGGKIACFVKLYLFIKTKENEWSKPIIGIGGNMLTIATKGSLTLSDEAFKMALTDAEGNAMKRLGLGADVYFEKDSIWDSKYLEYQQINGQQQPTITTTQKGRKKVTQQNESPTQQQQNTDLSMLTSACMELQNAASPEILSNTWYKYPQFSQEENFRKAYMVREQQLKTQPK